MKREDGWVLNAEKENANKQQILGLFLLFNDHMKKMFLQNSAKCPTQLNQSREFDEGVIKVVVQRQILKKNYEFFELAQKSDGQIKHLEVSGGEGFEEKNDKEISIPIENTNERENSNQQKNQKEQNYAKMNQSSEISEGEEQEVQQQTSQIQFGFQKFDFEDIKKAVGILQCFWKKGGRNGQTECVGYATAFAIAPRLIVTCAHGIFDPKKQRACNVAYFIPVDGVSSEDDVYETEEYDFLKFERIGRNCCYCFRPLRQDFALLVLKRPLNLKHYFTLSQISLCKGDQLQICGYPSEGYKFSTPRVGTNFARSDLKGVFEMYSDDINRDYILVRTMSTKAGHSGSPIIKLSKKGNKPKVVGIHTHRGSNGTNDGLRITLDLMNFLHNWMIELCDTHKIADKQTQQQLSQLRKALGYEQKSRQFERKKE